MPIWAMTPYEFDKFAEVKFLLILALGLTAAVVLVLRGIALNGFGIKPSAPLFLLLLLCMQATMSAVFSPNSEIAVWGNNVRYDGLLMLFAGASLFLLAYQSMHADAGVVGVAAKALVLASAPVCVYAIIQALGSDPIAWEPFRQAFGRPFSFLGNPIFLGAYCSTIVLVALGIALSARGKAEALCWAGLAGLNAACLVLSASRASWIAFAACVAVWCYWAWGGMRQGKRAVPVLLLSAVLASVVIVGAVVGLSGSRTGNGEMLAQSVQSVADISAPRNDGRLAIWGISLAMIRDFPFLGVGLDEMPAVFDEYRTAAFDEAEGADRVADKPHSSVLEWAIETGVPGALLFIGFSVVTLVAGGVRLVRSGFPRGPDLSIAAGLLLGATAYFIQALVTVTAINLEALWMVIMGLVAAFAIRSVAGNESFFALSSTEY